MKKLFLIKRKRELLVEVDIELVEAKDRREKDRGGIERRTPRKQTGITSIIMISRRIDEFEEDIRKKMESEMRIYSCKIHSQEFLRSLIPSLNKDRKC